MNVRRLAPLLLVTALCALGSLSGTAVAASAPAWKLSLIPLPTNFAPGAETDVNGIPEYVLVASNVGGKATQGTISATIALPPGITQHGTHQQTVSLQSSKILDPSERVEFTVGVDVADFGEDLTLDTVATVEGGGAPTVSITTPTTISASPVAFDILPGASGFSAALTEADGSSSTQAGGHPNQLTIDITFPIAGKPDEAQGFHLVGADGGVRDVQTSLPRGLIVNPLATPTRCTEAQLETGKCPDSSAVGLVNVLTIILNPTADPAPLYNMVAPPGTAASLGFSAADTGIFHLLGGVHAGDYALSADSRDILSRNGNQVLGVRVQLWGDPSSSIHDFARGGCAANADAVVPCPAPEKQNTPFLSLPTSCTSELTLRAAADSWRSPGVFHERSGQVIDADGNPTGVAGCNALEFSPTLKARPTTNVADSPSGLSADLHIPQSNDLGTLATAHLRKAVVTLPEGLVLNPSGANGLAGCSSAQIGIDPQSGLADGNAPACPDASKIGSVEVDTPLVDHPLPGSVFVATPHDNPFASLLAVYVAVDDPRTGVVVKLAGHVEADPQTGRLTTIFDDGPQVPFEDFKLEFFGGAAAPLRTPATCGSYSTTSELTPWSAPDSGPPATPSDTYAIDQAPAGDCASNEAALPNAPSFNAGSVSAIAGSYAPFVLNLRRNDATQQFSAVSLTPPPGLVGKLAGTPYCPDSALAAAAAKSGNQEKAAPSCPAASQVGTADVAAGAGPAPYYTQGKVYLAGPYKGAPLSMAIVTPATAGPYDLGTVVVRSALQIDPETTRITAVSDPIPQILQGIPLDVRSAQVKLDKPEFTLNPTSCNPMSVGGRLLSTLGQAAPLSDPFQVAECGRLTFKPQLALSLKGDTKRGGHPALRAVLSYPKGASANIAKASVALPHSEFLEQAHIKTICTRVQFAANACPGGSVYGRARAVTPLLDQPLEGPVYLRSSSNPLPDLVADLNGQIHVVLAGRIDSVKGGIRNTFEAVPDAPVSKFVLEMQGGKKGLLVNSRNLCKSVNKANVLFDGQNGKTYDSRPALKNSCKGKAKGKKHRRAAR
jgi:hypothetical protein